MCGWGKLPEDVREAILAYTHLTPFHGGSVPSIGQLAVNARVSRQFKEDSDRAQPLAKAAFDVSGTVLAMRTAPLQTLNTYLAALGRICEGLPGPADFELCSKCLHRLSFVPSLDTAVRQFLITVSKEFDKPTITSEVIKAASLAGKLLFADQRLLNDAPGPEDTAGLKALVGEIQQRFPKETHLCVALGASADPVAVGLGMQGYIVKYLPMSGIDRHTESKPELTNYVKAQVKTWPVFQNILVIDCMASGISFSVMNRLIGDAYIGAKPNIVLFSLNQPDYHDLAQDLVKTGAVQVSRHDSIAQQRILLQEYKEGAVGRLFPKSEGKVPAADAPANLDALKRMVAALLQDDRRWLT